MRQRKNAHIQRNIKMTKKKISPAITLNHQNIRELKNQLHSLKPIVIIGSKGLTKTVIQEIEQALNDHELIKIRIHTEDRKMLFKTIEDICKKTLAISIQVIGHVAAIYRKNLQQEEAIS